MSTDIYWVVEVAPWRNETTLRPHWIGVQHDDSTECLAVERWYGFFNELAGVRGTSPTSYVPRGLPDDISDLTKLRSQIVCWSNYQSWLSMEEFMLAYLRAESKSDFPVARQKPLEPSDLFGDQFWTWNAKWPTRVVFGFD